MAIKYTKREFNNNLKEPAIDKEFLNDFQDYVISIDEEGGSGSASVEVTIGRTTITKGTIISNGKSITLPIPYKAGTDTLWLFWNGTKLIKATDAEDGHYKESASTGSTSTTITMYRTETDGNYTLPEDVLLEEVVIKGGATQ